MFKLFTKEGTLHEAVWVIKQNQYGVSNVFKYMPLFEGTEWETEEYFGSTVHPELLILPYHGARIYV